MTVDGHSERLSFGHHSWVGIFQPAKWGIAGTSALSVPIRAVCSHNLIRMAMMHIQRLAVTYESALTLASN
jgi:hypothetical protein